MAASPEEGRAQVIAVVPAVHRSSIRRLVIYIRLSEEVS